MHTNSQKLVKSESDKPFSPNWSNISFFGPVHLIGILGWPIYLMLGGDIQWAEVLVFIFMFFLGTLSIDVGYHRSLSHLSFKMSPVLKFLMLFGGATTAEGSALTWASDHRRHHKFQDTDKDPYNIKRGFWWAHMGWIIGAPSSSDYSNCPDLQRDRLVSHQHRYYELWMIFSAFLFPLAVGFVIDRPIATLLLAGFTRLFLVNHFTFLINSYAHYFGRRPYSTDITARDSLICAILAQGEGWHNFHHKFPFDYRNGHRFYHYDPAKWVIQLCSLIGQATQLKKTPSHEIFRARIQTQKKKIRNSNPHLERVSEALDEALLKWQRLSLEWNRFKEDSSEAARVKAEALQASIQNSREEFLNLYRLWRQTQRVPVPVKA